MTLRNKLMTLGNKLVTLGNKLKTEKIKLTFRIYIGEEVLDVEEQVDDVGE